MSKIIALFVVLSLFRATGAEDAKTEPAPAPAPAKTETAKKTPAPTTSVTTKDLTAAFLNPNDYVAISFWIISIAMVAATVFFLTESLAVGVQWKTSVNVGALVTLVAAVHYFYMREYWIIAHKSPILYRYIDWSITVPLQMVEFYFILSAVNDNIGSGMFFRLFLGTVAMLGFGYAGEAAFLNAWLAFALGMAGWVFILFEVFAGEAGKEAGSASAHVQKSYGIMKFIVSIGWSIYPAGYFFGYLIFNHSDDKALNLIYNLADFVNKIAFCLAIWSCAKSDTAAKIASGAAGYKNLA